MLPSPPPRLTRTRPARRGRALAGFSLIELMVIVTIVMIIAALAAPGMMRGMAINRAQRGAGQLARIGRRARSEAVVYGRAYVLRYVGPATAGRYELWRGLNDGCRTNPWTTIITAGGCNANDPDCADVFDTAQFSSPAHRIAIVSPTPDLCFQPNGDMFVGNAMAAFNMANAAVRVQLDRFDGGVAGGATPVESRWVVFPPLAAPRVVM